MLNFDIITDEYDIIGMNLLISNCLREYTPHEFKIFGKVIKFFINNDEACSLFDKNPESAMDMVIKHLKIKSGDDSAFIHGLLGEQKLSTPFGPISNESDFVYGMRLIIRYNIEECIPMRICYLPDMTMYVEPFEIEPEEIHTFEWER